MGLNVIKDKREWRSNGNIRKEIWAMGSESWAMKGDHLENCGEPCTWRT